MIIDSPDQINSDLIGKCLIHNSMRTRSIDYVWEIYEVYGVCDVKSTSWAGPAVLKAKRKKAKSTFSYGYILECEIFDKETKPEYFLWE